MSVAEKERLESLYKKVLFLHHTCLPPLLLNVKSFCLSCCLLSPKSPVLLNTRQAHDFLVSISKLLRIGSCLTNEQIMIRGPRRSQRLLTTHSRLLDYNYKTYSLTTSTDRLPSPFFRLIIVSLIMNEMLFATIIASSRLPCHG